MSAALPFIAIAATAGGKIMEGVNQRDAAYADARVQDENARLTLLSGEQQAWQSRLDERRQTGEMIAGMAGSGALTGSGSAASLIAEASYQRELEILGIRQKATRQSNNYTQQANDSRAAGRGALTRGIFSAVSSTIGSLAQMRQQQQASSSNQQVWDEQNRRPPPITIGG